MKLNRAERLVVNNPLRRASQYLEIRWFYRKMPLMAGAEILEIGCGRGAGARLINTIFKPKELFLLDLDIHMIRKARDYLGTGNNQHISYCTARATFLPFHNGSFDAIFGFGFLHHVLKWQNSLKEIARVLRPGGIYYMLELYPALYQNFLTGRLLVHPTRNRFNGPELKKELRDVGLGLAHTFEITHMGILGIGIKS
jgi:ubiquinone/menaquinone biosynthesis C-methylase UbiE